LLIRLAILRWKTTVHKMDEVTIMPWYNFM
jgi:hypothetical protein